MEKLIAQVVTALVFSVPILAVIEIVRLRILVRDLKKEIGL